MDFIVTPSQEFHEIPKMIRDYVKSLVSHIPCNIYTVEYLPILISKLRGEHNFILHYNISVLYYYLQLSELIS